ncbi:LLM class flavin-dependent oxidoreductase [Amycolatopsis jejuensis]|uniref:LLM class flavin-dependent oxidoreductase n=1 Tax=Amycolatopsis jejuensis TaxID=330084 RepID=UPI000525CC4F|nr:LLM class flavin-dependent oxidoreductase [Amycolatopsis jejuensis]
MNPLTFGAPVSVHPQVDPLDDLQWADRQPGIEGAWLIDHLQGWFPRGTDGGVLEDPHQLLDPLSLLAAGAVRTERVALGVAVTDPLRRSSVALAQGASTISWLGQRPMRLGVGAGDPGQLRPFGLHSGRERTGRLDYVRPALRQLDELRTADPSATGLGIAEVSGYELYVAAHGPRMLELAATHADGWLPTTVSPKVYREKLDHLRAHAESIGRDPGTIRPTLFTWSALAPTARESRALLAHPSVRAVALYRGPAGFAAHGASYPLEHSYVPDEVPPDQATGLLAAIPDAVVADAVLHGSPEEVREQLQEYHDAGCEHVIFNDIGRFTDPEGTERFRTALMDLTRW